MTKGYSRQYYQNQHKKDVLWQIFLPISLGAVAFLILGILAGFSLQGGTDSASRWSHIAVMWLLLPVFIVGFFAIILLLGMIFGVGKLFNIISVYSVLLLNILHRINNFVRKVSNKTIQPVLWFRTIKSAINRFFVAFQYTLTGGSIDRHS